MEKLQHLITGDGSSTLYAGLFGEPYHSRHGAVQESLHVFIRMGLEAFPTLSQELNIFEMGLGTGLNALLSLLNKSERSISYTAVEAFPLGPEDIKFLNYSQVIPNPEAGKYLNALHAAPWGEWVSLQPDFRLYKHAGTLQDFEAPDLYDLVYYDAFAPESQPELWTEAVFLRIYGCMAPGAILSTYCAKGAVRRAMQAAGFEVERLPGPPGKREMLRARKR